MCVHGELCSGVGVVECVGSPSLCSMFPTATAWVTEGGYLLWWYEFALLACRRSTTAGLVFVAVEQRRIGRSVIAVLDVSGTFGIRRFFAEGAVAAHALSAVITPVCDGGDEPHHGDHEEYRPDRVEVKHAGTASF